MNKKQRIKKIIVKCKMDEPLKIGIVLNYAKAEKKKDELISIKSKKMPWLSLANDPMYNKLVIKVRGKKYVPADVAIGLYIEHNYPGVEIDYIEPDDISTERFKKNSLNFIIIYDLLEAFHLADKSKFKKFTLNLFGKLK
jgi:hypothetical protein